MSFDGRRHISVGEDDRRVDRVERTIISIVFSVIICFSLWVLLGLGLMVSDVVPIWVPLVAVLPMAGLLYWIDVRTEE